MTITFVYVGLIALAIMLGFLLEVVKLRRENAGLRAWIGAAKGATKKDPRTTKSRAKTGWTPADCREARHTIAGDGSMGPGSTWSCWDSSHEDGPLWWEVA